MNKGPFRNISNIIESDEIIRTDNYLNLARNNELLWYSKRDFLYRDGIWRGEEQSSIFKKRTRKNVKLLIGHSDIATNIKDQIFIKSLGYKYIYGTNTHQINSLSKSLPLGLTNFTKESEIHPILGNDEFLLKANDLANFTEKFKFKFYLNFNMENNVKERNQFKGIIENGLKNSTLVEEPSYTESGRIDFLTKLREIPMTICPFGNGYDTHRFWEVVYMGGVPIVKKCKYLESFFENLPVIQIDRWDKIMDYNLIEELWFKAQNFVWNPRFIEQSYWNQLILGVNNQY
jgi:hypothetical protein